MAEPSLFGKHKFYDVATFKNGKLSGEFISYYSNKQINFRVNYKSGRPNGPFFWNQINGTALIKGTFKYGKPDGIWEYCDLDNIYQRGEFKKGHKTGRWQVYANSGSTSLSKNQTKKELIAEYYFDKGLEIDPEDHPQFLKMQKDKDADWHSFVRTDGSLPIVDINDD